MDPLDPSVTDALRAWKTQYEAGLGMPESLQLCAGLCKSAESQKTFLDASSAAAQGADMPRLLEILKPALPPAERGALRVGFKYGRFEHTLGALIEHRELWYRTRQRIRSKMVLPAATLLLASFVAPLPFLVSTGNFILYFFMVATPITIGVVACALFAQAMQSRAMNPTAGQPASKLDSWLLSVPIIKGVERCRNLAEFAGLTAPLIGAGAGLADTLELCSEVLPNGYYRADLAAASRAARNGMPFSESQRPSDRWPAEFLMAVAVGEKSGALEDTMRRQAVDLRARYTVAIELLGEWLPRVAYGIVALFIIVNIFMMLMGYIGLITSLSQ